MDEASEHVSGEMTQGVDGRIPAFGYLCLPAHVSRTRAMELRREMAVYAIVSELNITRWFVDDRSSGGAALRDMVSAIEQ